METNSIVTGYHKRRSIVSDVFLIALGAIFFIGQFDSVDINNVWHYLPLLWALLGAIEILTAVQRRHVTRGFFKMIFGVWLFACVTGIWG